MFACVVLRLQIFSRIQFQSNASAIALDPDTVSNLFKFNVPALDKLKEEELQPIVDIGVVFTTKENPPPGYMLLKKSVGGAKADINRGSGGRDIFLCYKRKKPPTFNSPSPTMNATNDSKEKEKEKEKENEKNNKKKEKDKDKEREKDRDLEIEESPITGLSVVFPDTYEEPPYGFEFIEHTVSGNLSVN